MSTADEYWSIDMRGSTRPKGERDVVEVRFNV